MKQTLLWLLLNAGFSITILTSADTNIATLNTASLQREIDKTVWTPFKRAFETLDGVALNSLYDEEVLRVTPAGIDTEEQFKLGNLERFDANRSEGDSIELNFWFDKRDTNETTSYEVGFYRISITPAEGQPSRFYGQFHIVLSKRAGTWKISQDWDTASIGGKPIGENLFNSRTPEF